MHQVALDRRQFLCAAACGLAAPTLLAAGSPAAMEPRRTRSADACILIWLAGGVAQNDTWDPKPFTPFRRGMRGDELLSTCRSIETAAPGVRLGAGLEEVASVLDRGCVVRAVTSGDRACAPSAASHEDSQRRLLSIEGDAIEAIGAAPPTDPSPGEATKRIPRGSRRSCFAHVVPDRVLARTALSLVAATPRGDFASSVVDAREQVKCGGRFVRAVFPYEPFRGFDTHDHGAQRTALLKRQIDRPIAELVRGLERSGLLERTLVVVASEFGRTVAPARGTSRDGADPAAPAHEIVFDDESDYGFHGHFAPCMSVVLFGGGVRRGVAVGRTAERHPMVAVEDAVGFDDLRATIASLTGGASPSGGRVVDAILA